MNLDLKPSQRSRMHLAILRAIDARPERGTVHDVKADAWAELLAFHPDKFNLVTAMTTVISARIGTQKIVSLDADQLASAVEGDTIAARLTAALCGLQLVRDHDVDANYYHTVGHGAETISTDTMVTLVNV